MSNAIEIQKPTQIQEADVHIAPAALETTAILSVIERAAANPNVDIDKMERLMLMHERILERNAKASFASAMSAMQMHLPTVEENGAIVVKDKITKEVIQSTPYALWEDINEAIKPVMAQYGFSLSFKTGIAADGKITVTGILYHRDGHQEETTITLPYDSSGSKNAVQSVGSSVSYGKRYTASALLNITSRGEDDDATSAAPPPPEKEKAAPPAKSASALKKRDETGKDAWDKLIEDLRADFADCTSTILLGKLRSDYRARARDERWPKSWLEALANEFDSFEDELTKAEMIRNHPINAG